MPTKGHEFFIKNKTKKPKYIIYQHKLNNFMDVLQIVEEKLYKFKKNVGYTVGRNPFSINKEFYDGYIYEFDTNNLENCSK